MAGAVGAARAAAAVPGVVPPRAPAGDPYRAEPSRQDDAGDRELSGGAADVDDGMQGDQAGRRRQRRTRMISLAAATFVVLGILPVVLGLSAAGRDPVFASLDSLAVPAWASAAAEDSSSGSRWCFLECRLRERTTQSEQPFAKTAQAYEAALAGAGWQPWKVGQCPVQPIDGSYSCWRRDEFTLDLWVRQPACEVDAVAAQGRDVLPSANPDGSVDTPAPGTCTGSTVTIKVQNAITDQRGQPQPRPTLGETPDSVTGDDPLPGATPTPS